MNRNWPAIDPARIRKAIARRLRGPYAGIDRIDLRVGALGEELNALCERLERLESNLTSSLREQNAHLAASLGLLRTETRDALVALAARESQSRRLLQSLREEPEYERAWADERPLISVTVATVGRPELTSRSLPSILNQDYDEIEVIIAADGAAPGLESTVRAIADSRIRYLDLGLPQPWTDDPVRLWLVGATRARNAALKKARGRWIVEFDDDDAMRPECLSALIDLARRSHAEAVYGQVRQHAGATPQDICDFPPRLGRFSWAAGMYHAGLRFFERELLASDLGQPGDWWLAERMLRAGVRFAMREEVLCDAYASPRGPAARKRGRIPWADEN